jgi:hypothetical protein|tara:strand:+ start:1018 stop:1164 length:147 start_codon:yes stop_codon:yes gene_type:complete
MLGFFLFLPLKNPSIGRKRRVTGNLHSKEMSTSAFGFPLYFHHFDPLV